MTVRARSPLTNNDYDDYSPQINDNGYVVWQGWDGSDWEVFLYDGSGIIPLTKNTSNDRRPQINNNGYVVWDGYDDSDSEIFLAIPCDQFNEEIRLLASYPADLNSNPLAPPVTKPIGAFEFHLSEATACAGRMAVRFDLNSPEFDVTENLSRNADGTYTLSIDPLDPTGPCPYSPIEIEGIHYITLKADYYMEESSGITLRFLVVEDALTVRPAEVYEMTPSHSPGDQEILTVPEGTPPYTWSAVCGAFYPGCFANDISQCTGNTCTVAAGPYLGRYHVEVKDAANTRTRISVTIEEPPQVDALRLEPNFIVTKVNETVELGIEGRESASGFECAAFGGSTSSCQVIFDGQDYKVRYTAGGLAGDDHELKVWESADPSSAYRVPISHIQPGLAILVTGAGHPPHAPGVCEMTEGTLSDDLEVADITNQVYTTFQRGGFSNDAIYFLYGNELPHEEGSYEYIKPCWLDSSYGVAARNTLEQAIKSWAYTETLTRFEDPQDATLYIYLLDHGTQGETFYLYDAGDQYCANQNGTVNGCDCTAVAEGQRELDPEALRTWIEEYQGDVATATGKAPPTVVVVLDFCYSGSFVDDLDHVPLGDRPGDKIVVTSVGAGETTNINRLASFSIGFFNALDMNRTVWDAFQDGTGTQSDRTPMLDDNNDGMGDFRAPSCPSSLDGCVSREFKPFKQSFGNSFCPPTAAMSQGTYMVTAAGSEATTLWDHEAPLPTSGENPVVILGAAFDVVVAVPVEVEEDIHRILATVVPPGVEFSEAPILTFIEDDDRLTTTLTEYRVTIAASVLSETGTIRSITGRITRTGSSRTCGIWWLRCKQRARMRTGTGSRTGRTTVRRISTRTRSMRTGTATGGSATVMTTRVTISRSAGLKSATPQHSIVPPVRSISIRVPQRSRGMGQTTTVIRTHRTGNRGERLRLMRRSCRQGGVTQGGTL